MARKQSLVYVILAVEVVRVLDPVLDALDLDSCVKELELSAAQVRDRS